MTTENHNDSGMDARVRELLRRGRPEADLPVGFQNSVWRRIERAEAPVLNGTMAERLDWLVGWLLRPRLALALAAVVMVGGVTAGVSQGEGAALGVARERYLASVNPPDFRP